jgi:hypothetical protein
MLACACCLLGASSVSIAQVAPAVRAPPAVLDWNKTFPVTPLFSNWTRLSFSDVATNKYYYWFLHSESLHWKQIENSGRWLEADMITYTDAADNTPAAYKRVVLELSCNANKIAVIEAVVFVDISPDGKMSPTSAVHAGDYWDVLPRSDDDFYHALCFDDSIHQRFLARAP